MSEKNTYKISVIGPGVNFEKEVDKKLAERAILMLLGAGDSSTELGGESGTTGEERPGASRTGIREKHEAEISVRELFNEKQPKRNPDKIAAIGYYLQNHQHMAGFSSKNVAEQFERAAEPIPKNLSRDMKWTAKAGWIAERQGRAGDFYITKAGIAAVEAKFAKEQIERTRHKTGTQRKRRHSEKEPVA